MPAPLPPPELEPRQGTLLSAAAGSTPVLWRAPRIPLRWLLRLGLVLMLAGLLFVAFRRAPIAEIAHVLQRLQAWQVALLLVVDSVIYVLISARWWFVVHAEQPSARFIPMVAVRLSVFGISYFTLGPQIGGEPLQVIYLRRRHNMTYARATASVVMDKLFELLGNFVLLCFGLIALLHSGLLSGLGSVYRLPLVGLALLACWPLLHIALLYIRVYPISAALGLLPRSSHSKPVRFIRAAEHLAGQFCQRHPRHMLAGLVVSLVAAVVTVSEYALITSFLHIQLPFWQLVTGWAGGWLAFLVPVPGGLGALEASQVWVLGSFGVPAASAISVPLLMRGRDLLLGGLGLLLAGDSARKT